MADIISTILNVVSAPFALFFRPQPQNAMRYVGNQPVNRQQVIRQASQPQSLPEHIELMQIETEMGLPVSGFNDEQAILYLPRMREELQKYRAKQVHKASEEAKYAAGQQEIDRKAMQYKQAGDNSYYSEQNRRQNNAAQFSAKYNAEQQPYVNWMNQKTNVERQYSSSPPMTIKFG